MEKQSSGKREGPYQIRERKEGGDEPGMRAGDPCWCSVTRELQHFSESELPGGEVTVLFIFLRGHFVNLTWWTVIASVVLCDFVSLLSVSLYFFPFLCLLSLHPLFFVYVCLSLLSLFLSTTGVCPSPDTHTHTHPGFIRITSAKGPDITGSTCALTLCKHTSIFSFILPHIL